ncbi:multidrug transporter [Stutzerimonas kirkiae]|uniref:Multidrug transporter n=1 Tax=Stutzerimonas kirkiae TaxID=2211392 RepID=A0A4Q9R6P1_9GAMM|nr:efflux transporter outer membrane subunit [Stutzerimonas kirkiae]TBU96250.1 multidrug transporter [Stutzerimonas kirkiae]TBV03407.1 multidrug transporter [Stutzerimonas kirkiae]
MNRTAACGAQRLAARLVPVLLSLLAGCVSLPSARPPSMGPAEAALGSRAAIVATQPALSDAPVPVQWWRLFNDSTLLALEEEVAGNLDLQAGVLRIEESRAQLGLASAARHPHLSADAGYSRSGISRNSGMYQLGQPAEGTSTWSLGLQADWEVDFWGRLRYLDESAQASLDAAYYGWDALQVSVSAEVARGYLLLRGVQAQAALVEDNLRIAEELLGMAESRERNGVASRFDAASARADVAVVEARLVQLQHQRDASMNALALLLGKLPRELDGRLVAAGLPPMPERLPLGIPSEIARQRPDILQAEARLRAALADIGAAKADFYPRISLTGSLGAQAFRLSDLGSWDSRRFSIGPTLYLPIFDGGRLKSNLALSEARHRLAGIAYRQTVLRAWHEVDDALGAYASELKRHQRLQSALEQNRMALAVAQRSYQEGSADFTVVLVARRTLLNNQSELADCATASALAVVSLYRALGGGWSAQLQETATPGASS